jgi:hypothetical protein
VRGWCGGVFADGPTAANRRRGAPREHQLGSGVTPGKAGRGGGRVPKRWGDEEAEEGLGTTAFTGGEGASMGSDGGCGVL